MLDTAIVIDLLKKVPAVVGRFLGLLDAETHFLICPIVMAEVYAGAFKREHKGIEALFDRCLCIDIDNAIGRQAGWYANQYSKAFQGI